MKTEQQIRDYLAEQKRWFKLMDGADSEFRLVEGIIEALEFVLDRNNEQPEPELSKSFNMCDECMETNETQDYSVPMYYNIEQNVFECLNGHTEDPINHFRQDSRDSLFDIVMGLLGANPPGTCQVYGRKNRPAIKLSGAMVEVEDPADRDDRLYHEEQDHIAMEKAKDNK